MASVNRSMPSNELKMLLITEILENVRLCASYLASSWATIGHGAWAKADGSLNIL